MAVFVILQQALVHPSRAVLTLLTISDDDIDDDGNTLSDPTDLAASSSPSIETVKTVVITDDTGPTGLSDGDTVTYTIVNTNTGNVTLTDVNIQSDTLTRLNGNPIGSLTADSFGVVGGTTLAPGEFNTYTATYTVVQADIDGGGLRNTATGVGTPLGGGPDVTDISDDDIDDDGNTLSDPTDLAASSSPSIETVKTVVITDDTGPTGLSDGDTVTYTIVNTNTGNVTLTDVNIQSDTLTRLNGNPIGSLTADSFGVVGGTTLAPGEFNTYTATYTVVQADIDGGGLRNTATGVGTPLRRGPDVTDTVMTTLMMMETPYPTLQIWRHLLRHP